MADSTDAKLVRATQLLQDAIQIILILRASAGSDPYKGVVLDRLREDLLQLHTFLEELKFAEEPRLGWKALDRVFDLLVRILTSTLFCLLYPLMRVNNKKVSHGNVKNYGYRQEHQGLARICWPQAEGVGF